MFRLCMCSLCGDLWWSGGPLPRPSRSLQGFSFFSFFSFLPSLSWLSRSSTRLAGRLSIVASFARRQHPCTGSEQVDSRKTARLPMHSEHADALRALRSTPSYTHSELL